MSAQREQTKELLRKAVNHARTWGPQALGHPGGVWHYIDEDLADMLQEVMTEPVDPKGVKHEEAETIRELNGTAVLRRRRCPGDPAQ